MAKKVAKKIEKKIEKKPSGSNLLLESEYYTDIEITDPYTGEKRLYKKVKVKRYKSTSSLATKRIVGQTESILGNDDSLEGCIAEGADEE